MPGAEFNQINGLGAGEQIAASQHGDTLPAAAR
jgi:hypothetical protein